MKEGEQKCDFTVMGYEVMPTPQSNEYFVISNEVPYFLKDHMMNNYRENYALMSIEAEKFMVYNGYSSGTYIVATPWAYSTYPKTITHIDVMDDVLESMHDYRKFDGSKIVAVRCKEYFKTIELNASSYNHNGAVGVFQADKVGICYNECDFTDMFYPMKEFADR